MTESSINHRSRGEALDGPHYGENAISFSGRLDYSYDVLFSQEDILSVDNSALRDLTAGRKCMVVMSETVDRLYGGRVRDYFRHGPESEKCCILTIPVGENTKNIDTVMRICKEGRRFGLDRRSLFVAMGGGVLTDVVGMASSIYMRKLNYVRIPTTLVGQVDAGVGLKNGVDFDGVKNFIGSFHPPVSVLNDFRFLRTLDAEEIRNGLAEIAKMAIVADVKLFSTLERNSREIVDYYKNGTNPDLTREISISAARRMLEQLQLNPFENSLRRLVDFGHTFSPFLEMHTDHRIKHGRAVAVDMAISTEISYLLGRIDARLHDRILSMLTDFGFNLHEGGAYDVGLMWQSLDSILLRRGGKLNLVIPTGPGKADFLSDRSELERSVLGSAIENISGFQTAALK